MSEVSLRTKALALMDCSESDDCRECAWYGNNDVCDNVYAKTRLIVNELLEENDKLKEENEVLKERIAIMEVEREDDLK